MTSAHSAQSRKVDDLGHSMRVCQVKNLRVHEVITVEHHLCEEPIVVAVKRGL